MELTYQKIFEELNEQGIDYLIIGGLAVNFHGIPRMTYDIDLMIHLGSDNILKLVGKLTAWGYKPRAPVNPEDLADEAKRISWVQEKSMKAFTFYSEEQPIGEIDIVIDSPIPYQDLRERAVRIGIGKVDILVVSLRDLIDLKVQAGREQDLSDVENLKKISER